MNEFFTNFLFPFLAIVSAGFLVAVYRQTTIWDQERETSTGNTVREHTVQETVEHRIVAEESTPATRNESTVQDQGRESGSARLHLRPVPPPDRNQLEAYNS